MTTRLLGTSEYFFRHTFNSNLDYCNHSITHKLLQFSGCCNFYRLLFTVGSHRIVAKIEVVAIVLLYLRIKDGVYLFQKSCNHWWIYLGHFNLGHWQCAFSTEWLFTLIFCSVAYLIDKDLVAKCFEQLAYSYLKGLFFCSLIDDTWTWIKDFMKCELTLTTKAFV